MRSHRFCAEISHLLTHCDALCHDCARFRHREGFQVYVYTHATFSHVWWSLVQNSGYKVQQHAMPVEGSASPVSLSHSGTGESGRVEIAMEPGRCFHS